MPLVKSKSKAAFGSNVKAEIAAGKPQKQAVAIAYAQKRKAGGKDPAPTAPTAPPSADSEDTSFAGLMNKTPYFGREKNRAK